MSAARYRSERKVFSYFWACLIAGRQAAEENLQTIQQEMEALANETSAQVTAAVAPLIEAQQELKNNAEERDRLMAENAKLQSHISDLGAQIAELKDKLAKSVKEISQWKQTATSMEENYREYKTMSESIQSTMNTRVQELEVLSFPFVDNDLLSVSRILSSMPLACRPNTLNGSRNCSATVRPWMRTCPQLKELQATRFQTVYIHTIIYNDLRNNKQNIITRLMHC